MVRLLSLILIVAFLAACATEPVFLKHTRSGRTAQCGPYGYTSYTATAAALREEKCINDFQRQGYIRLSGKPARRK